MLRTVIGLERSCHPLDQSDVGPQPITTWSPLFSHAMQFSCCIGSALYLALF